MYSASIYSLDTEKANSRQAYILLNVPITLAAPTSEGAREFLRQQITAGVVTEAGEYLVILISGGQMASVHYFQVRPVAPQPLLEIL